MPAVERCLHGPSHGLEESWPLLIKTPP
jgi:hypothetical protein